jgi:hypothetical protein
MKRGLLSFGFNRNVTASVKAEGAHSDSYLSALVERIPCFDAMLWKSVRRTSGRDIPVGSVRLFRDKKDKEMGRQHYRLGQSILCPRHRLVPSHFSTGGVL